MLKVLGTTLHNFILLACNVPHIRMHSIREHCDPAQRASPEASGSGSTMFSKKYEFQFSRIRVNLMYISIQRHLLVRRENEKENEYS